MKYDPCLPSQYRTCPAGGTGLNRWAEGQGGTARTWTSSCYLHGFQSPRNLLWQSHPGLKNPGHPRPLCLGSSFVAGGPMPADFAVAKRSRSG